MIYMNCTENNLGVDVYGDYLDFQTLYDSLHELLGDEKEYSSYESARIRILGLCYDLRHAIQGDRDYIPVENGIHDFKKEYIDFEVSDKNVYMKINVFWPELIFIYKAIDNFIDLQKNKYNPIIGNVRALQSAVNKLLFDVVPKATYTRIMKNLIESNTRYNNLYFQYVDYLNVSFIYTDKENRIKKLSSIVKKISTLGEDYLDIKRDIKNAAKEYGCSVDDIGLTRDYPDNFDW